MLRLAGALAFFCLSMAAAPPAVEADAHRGAEVFRAQKCTTCHKVDGAGGSSAPDLDRRVNRDYSPAGLVSRMWNHAPKMWQSMRRENLEVPALSVQDAADLFAYFMAKRFFEHPGNAGRGKKVFESKCADCHGATDRAALPITHWAAIADSAELAERMWNHTPEMQKALAERNREWPLLSGQEMTDLLLFLRSLPDTRGTEFTFALPSGSMGKQLLASKGCLQCHTGPKALEGRLGSKTLTDMTATLWNHAPDMRALIAPVSAGELREILAYVWQPAYYRPSGNAAAGSAAYAAKCSSCHGNAGVARDLTKSTAQLNVVAIVYALWSHGPAMLRMLQTENKLWPTLSEAEVANVMAFLNEGKE